MGPLFLAVMVATYVLIGVVLKTFIVVPMREHVIKERLGKYKATLNPGFHFMVPFVDKAAYRQEMREQAINVPAQMCITRDNIQVEVDGVVYLKVVDAYKASYGIGDYVQAAVNLAQTTMRSEVGKLTLDETFSERDRINSNIVREIDKASEPWGLKMMRYEIMNINPSRRVIDTMEKQMEAERDKRAEITISTAHRETQILLSEGHKLAAINESEGERLRRTNEATGRAEEIRVLADASAEGLRAIADAIRRPGGNAAVKAQLLEQFIEEYGHVLENANVSVVPADLAKVKGMFEGLGQVTTTLADTTGKGGAR